MRVGEQAVLAIEVEGTTGAAAPEIAALDGFSVQYIGPATQFSIAGGSVAQSVTHRYGITAARAGRFLIGPFEIAVGSETHRTEPIAVEVMAPTQAGQPGALPARQAGAPDLSLVLELPRREVFLHERVPVTLTLFIGATQIDQVQLPTLEGDAFSLEPFGNPVQARATVGGRPYKTVRFDTTLVPLQAGTLTVGPAAERMAVLMRRQRGDPMLDRFFGADVFADARPHELRSNAETLTVKRLPDDGRPPDFSGAVGRFNFEVSAQPVEVRVNDPVTVTMRISGSGHLGGVAAPALEGPGLRTYPPQDVKAEGGLARREFEQVLIPTTTAVREIPAVRFAYFDPGAGAYRIVTRGPIPLTVRPGAATTAAPAPTGEDRSAEDRSPERLGQDIVYIKDAPGRLRHAGPGVRWDVLLAFLLVPLAAHLGALAVARRRARLSGDPRYARFVAAGRAARAAITNARRRIAAGAPAEAYDELARAVRAYLSAKLDVPVGAVDAERVAERVGAAGAAVVGSVREFFTLVERARYAPGTDGADADAAVDLAQRIVRDLERRRGLAQRFTAGGTERMAALVVLWGALWSPSVFTFGAGLAAGADVAAVSDPTTTFFEANSLYKAGRYEEAAATYASIRAAGLEGAALEYNLGNAAFKAGVFGRAILHWERARRLAPRDPDVRANLHFARKSRPTAEASMPPEASLWLRLFVPLAPVASTRELAAATAGIYLIAMALLTARLFATAWRTALGRAAGVAFAAFVLTGSALGLHASEEGLRPPAVVVARAAETPVRFEPSPAGTVHFTLPEGAVVQVLDRRDGWQQVARADGRRGWIEGAALEGL